MYVLRKRFLIKLLYFEIIIDSHAVVEICNIPYLILPRGNILQNYGTISHPNTANDRVRFRAFHYPEKPSYPFPFPPYFSPLTIAHLFSSSIILLS